MLIDIVVLFVVLVSALISFIRGFVREILTIVGIVGAAVVAYLGGPYFAPLVREWFGVGAEVSAEDAENADKFLGMIPYEIVADSLAYGSIFLVFAIIFSVISHFLAEYVSNVGLGAIDRTVGVIFGLLRGVLLIGLLYLPLYVGLTAEQKTEHLAQSKTAPYLESVAGWMYTFFPQSLKQDVEEYSADSNLAKKILEEQGIAGQENQDDTPEGVRDGSGSTRDKAAEEGYSKEERNAMDQLIEDAQDNAPQYND